MTKRALKLYLLVETYFQRRDEARYGIEALAQQGIEVEVWEIFRPFRRAYQRTYRPPDPSDYSRILRFESAAELYQAVARLPAGAPVIAPWGWSYHFGAWRLFRELTRRDAYFGAMVISTVAPLGRGFRLPTLRGMLNQIYARVPRGVCGTRPWRFLLLCGGDRLKHYAAAAPQADLIWTHALDFDLLLQSGASAGPQRAAHIVFLDEYVPFHPDYVLHGVPPPNTAAEYYPLLVRFFADLEKRLGLPVVIAAHPRADYGRHEDYFRGRSIIAGRTCELVRDAALVVTHSSVSNNFTVGYRKPVVVVTTDGLARSRYGPYIDQTARMLGCPRINLDETTALPSMPVVDEAKYREFHEAIIKRAGTPDENTWLVFGRHLRQRLPGGLA